MVQDGLGQNDLLPSRILAFTRPKWCILVPLDLKNSRRRANGVVRKWGRTDLTGFEPDCNFSAPSGYALHL